MFTVPLYKTLSEKERVIPENQAAAARPEIKSALTRVLSRAGKAVAKELQRY
jgi:hypothetical protein